jgi:phosphoribosylformylglycinamidine cyclo-ligase
VGPGDVILGLASSGPHSNGYSLIRKIVELSGVAYDAPSPFSANETLAEALLTPTRIYVKSLLKVLKSSKSVKALAHITGGGFTENIPRVLPNNTVAEIDLISVPYLPVFKWLAKIGGTPEREMLRTFNCGVGMIVVVKAKNAKAVATALKKAGEKVVTLGVIRKRKGKEAQVSYSGAL